MYYKENNIKTSQDTGYTRMDVKYVNTYPWMGREYLEAQLKDVGISSFEYFSEMMNHKEMVENKIRSLQEELGGVIEFRNDNLEESFVDFAFKVADMFGGKVEDIRYDDLSGFDFSMYEEIAGILSRINVNVYLGEI
ncbi:MAG: hypothetical protein GX126_05910 [Bacteroidales bacterium]|jgi:hypothetical protein|nr:hypothetical protein [Bacteroidales bacterium]